MNWIRRIGEIVLMREKCEAEGSLSIIIVNDDKIRDLNSRFLKRTRPTDVMAFPLGDDGEGVWGEVYVSEDRAAEQASMYNVSFKEELARLVIHGILHLLGYDDQRASQRKKMGEREEHYLRQAMMLENSECK